MDDNTHLAPPAYQAFRQNNYAQAIELFQQQIDKLSQLEDSNQTDIYLLKNDLAVSLIVSEKSEEAIGLLEECLAYFRGSNNEVKTAMTLANLATAYEKQKNIPEAIAYYNQALANFPAFDDNDVKYFIHHNLSLLHLRKFQLNKAVLHRFQALEYKQYLTLADKLIRLILRIAP